MFDQVEPRFHFRYASTADVADTVLKCRFLHLPKVSFGRFRNVVICNTGPQSKFFREFFWSLGAGADRLHLDSFE
jgi:hypothetical protein